MINGNIQKLKESYPPLQDCISNLKKTTPNEYHGPCPWCGGDDRFIVYVDNQKYWCRQCQEKGDIINYQEKSTGNNLHTQFVAAGLSESKGKKANSDEQKQKSSKLQFTWNRSKPSSISLLSYFKKTRKIEQYKSSPAVRWNSFKTKDGDAVQRILLKLSKPGDDPKDPQSLHSIFLDTSEQPPEKVNTSSKNAKPRAMVGRGVWFYPDLDTKAVAIGEGVETMLSVVSVTDMNGAACLTTAGLGNLVLPKETEEVFIFVDEDLAKSDTDKKGWPGQRAAIKKARALEKEGKTVWLVTPSDTCFSGNPVKQDFNDLLKLDVTGGLTKDRISKKDKVEELDWYPPDEDEQGVTNGTGSFVEPVGKGLKLIAQSRSAERLIEIIKGKFAVSLVSSRWYQFTGEQWAVCERNEFHSSTMSSCTRESNPLGFSFNYYEGIIKLMKYSGKVNTPEQKDNKIPFKNGILDIKTMELSKTTPDNASLWCLPYEYDKSADCPSFLGWLNDAAQGDKDIVTFLRALINATLTVRKDLQYFIHLLGLPGTGKGTFSRILIKILGDDGYTTTDFDLLERDKFEQASLYQKRLVVFNEVKDFNETKKFLEVTGRDPLRYEQKHVNKAPSFIYEGQVLVLGNSFFSSGDQTSSAIERRRRTVEFNKVFSAEEKEVWMEMGGEEALLYPEIPGIINWALKMSTDEVSNAFNSPPERVKKSNQKAERANSSITDYMLSQLEPSKGEKLYIGTARQFLDGGTVRFEDEDEKLYPNYQKWCLETKRKAIGRRKFVDALLVSANRHWDGEFRFERGTRGNAGVPIMNISLKYNQIATGMTG